MARKSKLSYQQGSRLMVYVVLGFVVFLAVIFVISFNALQKQQTAQSEAALISKCNPKIKSLTPYNHCPCRGTGCPPYPRWRNTRYRCQGDTADRELSSSTCQKYQYWLDQATTACALRCAQMDNDLSEGDRSGRTITPDTPLLLR